jgi:hypothetical protein
MINERESTRGRGVEGSGESAELETAVGEASAGRHSQSGKMGPG